MKTALARPDVPPLWRCNDDNPLHKFIVLMPRLAERFTKDTLALFDALEAAGFETHPIQWTEGSASNFSNRSAQFFVASHDMGFLRLHHSVSCSVSSAKAELTSDLSVHAFRPSAGGPELHQSSVRVLPREALAAFETSGAYDGAGIERRLKTRGIFRAGALLSAERVHHCLQALAP